jgi:hypothetical protein
MACRGSGIIPDDVASLGYSSLTVLLLTKARAATSLKYLCLGRATTAHCDTLTAGQCLKELDRTAGRRRAETRVAAQPMADGYARISQTVLQAGTRFAHAEVIADTVPIETNVDFAARCRGHSIPTTATTGLVPPA